MTPIKNQKGFTIIEVLLFLAISGLFFLIALIGVGGRSQNAQFSDSIRSTQGYLEKEMASIRNGVNPTPGTTVGTDELHIFLGKMYQISDGTDEIKSYVIYGDMLNTQGRENDAIDQLIVESNPKVSSVPAETYNVRWGLTLRNSFSKGTPTGKSVGYFGFLLNPATNRLSTIIIEAEAPTYTGNPLTDLIDTDNYKASADILYDQSLSLHLCYENSSGRIAEVASGEEILGSPFTANFDDNVFDRCAE